MSLAPSRISANEQLNKRPETWMHTSLLLGKFLKGFYMNICLIKAERNFFFVWGYHRIGDMRKYVFFTIISCICLCLSIVFLVIFVEIYAVPHLLTSEFSHSTCTVVGFITIPPDKMDMTRINNSVIENLLIRFSATYGHKGSTEYYVKNKRHSRIDAKTQNLENTESLLDASALLLNDNHKRNHTKNVTIKVEELKTINDFSNSQNLNSNDSTYSNGYEICEYEKIHRCDKNVCTTTPIVISKLLSSKDRYLKLLVRNSRTYYSFITSVLRNQVRLKPDWKYNGIVNGETQTVIYGTATLLGYHMQSLGEHSFKEVDESHSWIYVFVFEIKTKIVLYNSCFSARAPTAELHVILTALQHWPWVKWGYLYTTMNLLNALSVQTISWTI